MIGRYCGAGSSFVSGGKGGGACQDRLYDDWQRGRETEYHVATTGTREPTWQRGRETTPPKPGSLDYNYALNKMDVNEACDM